MSVRSLDKLPDDPHGLELRREVRTTIDAYRSFLNAPAFQHQIDLAVLVKIAGDDHVPFRERRRAAEVLTKFRLQAMSALADLAGVRAQVLRELGLEDPTKATSAVQINQKIEVVRVDDWRAARAEFVDATPELPDAGEDDRGSEPDP